MVKNQKKSEKSGIEFESFGRFWDFETCRVTRGEVYDIESAEYQPISSHMDPNREKLVPKTSPRPNFGVEGFTHGSPLGP